MATVTDVQTIEAVGDRYSFEQLMSVRARTRRAVHMIANQVVHTDPISTMNMTGFL